MKSAHTLADSHAHMAYLTTLSLLQESMETNGRSRVQKEVVMAIFKTIPEFSWNECRTPPKMSG
jgi:hypothetical protein